MSIPFDRDSIESIARRKRQEKQAKQPCPPEPHTHTWALPHRQCGHSICGQNYIETGETRCVIGEAIK